MTTPLGIDSRVRYADIGEGVVLNLSSTGYILTFPATGVNVLRHTPPEVIEALEPASDRVSL